MAAKPGYRTRKRLEKLAQEALRASTSDDRLVGHASSDTERTRGRARARTNSAMDQQDPDFEEQPIRLTEGERRDIAQRTGITPLEYLVSVLRDPRVPMDIQIEAAKAAAPYMHRKMPIAIEGADGNKPISLDAIALKNLSRMEIATLRVLLVKTGLVKIPDPNAQPAIGVTVNRGAQTIEGVAAVAPEESEAVGVEGTDSE